jgi:hypothetical protein
MRPEPAKGQLSSGQRLERQMEELENAIRDPAASESQKDEFKNKLVEAQKMFEKIRAANREGNLPPF